MDSATRKAKLEELKANQFNQAMTGIPLRYKGSTRTEIVWRIPLDYLIYNDPVAYAELILNGNPEAYLKTVTEYKSLY